MEQLVYRVIIPICRILPILAVSLKMLLMSKELYIIGFTLIFRILRCTFHIPCDWSFTADQADDSCMIWTRFDEPMEPGSVCKLTFNGETVFTR